MASPLYFLPQTLTPAKTEERKPLLQSRGLSHLLVAPKILELWNHCKKGPDGSEGGVLTFAPPLGETCKVAYVPESQYWQDFGSFWLGRWTCEEPQLAPPRPIDLQRHFPVFADYLLKLGDGNNWAIPVVPVDLPRSFAVAKDGKPYMRIKRDFLDLIPLAKKYLDARTFSAPLVKELEAAKSDEERERLTRLIEEKTPSDLEMGADLTLLLSKNYYVSQYEVSFLELLDIMSMARVVDHCIRDHKAIIEADEALKKNGV